MAMAIRSALRAAPRVRLRGCAPASATSPRFISMPARFVDAFTGSSVDDSAPRGLFQLPELIHARDFARLTRDAKAKCHALKHEHLDEISNTICSIVDAAELCRNVHPDAAYRQAARDCVTELSDFIQNVNADVELYHALRAVAQDTQQMASFTEEQRRMTTLLLQEFERDGIHLSHGGRQRVIKLQNEVTELGMEFQRVMFSARDYVEIPERMMRALPHSVVSACQPKLLDRSVLRVPTDLHVMNTVLKWVGDPEVRREMYIKGNSCATENLLILEELQAKRHELALQLGFPSYAHFAMSDRMTTSPDDTKAFINSFSSQLMPKARQELAVLQTAKYKRERGTMSDVAMWDLPYYMGMLKAQEYRIDSRILTEYFPLERCLDGLRLVCHELFGMELTRVPMDKHESWHPDVHKLALTTRTVNASGAPQTKTLGVIYFDLYPRAHKYNHAAHFTIRCGRRLSASEYQTPLVALVCNFNKPAPHAPSLLTHSEVETLFHEFGHAMHSLLSRTEFQHLSGTRAALDFVETPSHLFEYLAWDYRVVREFARHHETNESIPERMMSNLRASKHMFAAMDAQTQCFYSLLDLALFGEPNGGDGSGGGGISVDGSAIQSSTQMMRDLQNQHTLVPHVNGTCWQTRFGHLIGYGAGYYSYLSSRVFAADLWNSAGLRDDPLNAATGQKLVHQLLAHGGAKDPNEMLRELIGRAPTPASYLEELGISNAVGGGTSRW